jgi:hypothetical protein
MAGAAQSSNPGQHTLCEMTSEKISAVLTGLREGRYSSNDWKDCKMLGCFGLDAFAPPDRGCAWGECREGARALGCAAAGKTLGCKPVSQSAVAVDSAGKPLCVVRCAKAGGDVEQVCPK